MNSIDKSWVDTHIDSNGEVTIPEGVEVIKKGAFQGNNKIKRVIMPDSVVGIEPRAFADCPNLQEVRLNDNLQVLGMNSFRNCTQLRAITIPDKVTTIYPGTFEGNTSLESITLNGGLDYLSADGFINCDNLSEVTINGVSRLDYNAFMQKGSIKKITIDGQEFTISDSEQLFSIQKAGEKVAIVTQSKDTRQFSTQCINLEKNTSKNINNNIYLTDDGRICYAIDSLADTPLVALEQFKKSGLTNLYIYGGENEITPNQHSKNFNFNLYSIDDLIKAKSKILELKKEIKLPDKNDPDREKKIYGQIVRNLSQMVIYDEWGASESIEEYESKTGKSHEECIEKNDQRNLDCARLESRNLLGFLNGETVCQGNAEIIRNIAAEYGITVECIRGTKSGAHEWNQVKLDGIWYDDDFTNYREALAKGDFASCQCFLIGTRYDGKPLTKVVGYKTKEKIHDVGSNFPMDEKKVLLNYGRVQQQAHQQAIQPHEKERPPEESIKDEVGDESKPKTQSQEQDEQQAEVIWMNRLQACDEQVAKIQDGAKKKQEVVKLIQDLEQERRQEKNAEIQEENQNYEQR